MQRHSIIALLLVLGSALATDLWAIPVLSDSDYVFVDSFESSDCSAALTCPAPAPGTACLAGQLSDVGSTAPLRALFNKGLACGSGAVGGPCDLALSAYDALAFAMNPQTSPPLASADRLVDGCGRFRFSSLNPPGSGSAAVVIDDNVAASDLHVPTAIVRAFVANQSQEDLDAVAALRDTVNAWTQSAGNPFGSSNFADVGAILFSFKASGVPRSGVTVTNAGNTVPAKDYYFADASLQRTQVDDALTATGTDGAALFVNGGSGTYSGVGGESMGCTWPTMLATSVTGVLLYVEIDCQGP